MGRKPRIEYPGGVYHVIQRGNNREYIFQKEAFKSLFMTFLLKCKERMDFELYGFVMMDNHYHLIIRTHDYPLSQMMHRLNSKFSRQYNIYNQRTGHVYENRYKSILVKDDQYLLSLLRYVHQNPVKANICKHVKDYRWSSDAYYRQNLTDNVVDIDFILNIFSLDRSKALREYMKFMDMDEMESSDEFEDVPVIGEKKPISIEVPIEKIDQQSLDDILRDVSQEIEIFNQVKQQSRKRSLTQIKKQYVQKALDANYRMKEIGENIGISEAAVSMLVKDTLWHQL